jgi:hypothetical protein
MKGNVNNNSSFSRNSKSMRNSAPARAARGCASKRDDARLNVFFATGSSVR